MKCTSFKLFGLVIAVSLFCLIPNAVANAKDNSENIISTVSVSKSKMDPTGYELNIDSTKSVQYKSHIEGDRNVYFDLKNSTLAPDMGTIYNDVNNIDNLSIKQLDKNKVRIYLTGKNVKNTELVFVNEVFETTPKISKKININRPINEYKATNYEDDLDETQEMQSWDDNSFNFSHLGITMIQTILTSPIAKGITGFICLLILFLVIKSITSNISKDQEPLIGLNGAKLNEHDNFDEQSDQYALGTNCFDINEINNQNTRNKTLELAQNELKKAHEKYQQYVKDKYGALKQPKKVDFDAIKQSIALNQYQKTSQNPYQNQPVVNMDKVNNLTKGYTSDIKTKFDRSDDFSLGENKASFVPKNPVMPKKEFTSPYIKRKTNLVKDDSFNVQKPNMKFLDSVTKIYERSGREDLANGLKNSISKAKQII